MTRSICTQRRNTCSGLAPMAVCQRRRCHKSYEFRSVRKRLLVALSRHSPRWLLPGAVAIIAGHSANQTRSSRAPAPSAPRRSSSFMRGHRSTLRQPHPMHSAILSRSAVISSMRRVSSAFQAAASLAQSFVSGVASLGRCENAFEISASGIPTLCATLITAIRRRIPRGKTR